MSQRPRSQAMDRRRLHEMRSKTTKGWLTRRLQRTEGDVSADGASAERQMPLRNFRRARNVLHEVCRQPRRRSTNATHVSCQESSTIKVTGDNIVHVQSRFTSNMKDRKSKSQTVPLNPQHLTSDVQRSYLQRFFRMQSDSLSTFMAGSVASYGL